MERKALFFDIDGTLLSEETGKVPASARKALEEAMARGHLCFINTGRTRCSLPLEIKAIPFSGYLCGCGTQILYGDEELYSRTIPRERREKSWWTAFCPVGRRRSWREGRTVTFPARDTGLSRWRA